MSINRQKVTNCQKVTFQNRQKVSKSIDSTRVNRQRQQKSSKLLISDTLLDTL